VLIGNGTVFLEALKSGATGAILAVGCAVPEVCVEIFKSSKAGDWDRAERLQTNLTPLAAAVTTRFGIGGLKAAMDLAGYCGGGVRSPLRSPSEAEREEIATLLSAVRTTDLEIV
jgi:4-hydroxy-2-oxoglutarate aldolase